MVTATDIIYYAIVGILGALARELVVHRNTIFFPRRWEVTGEDGKLKKGCDTGILGAFIVGAIVSILVDGSYRTAFAASVAAPHIIEEIAKRYRTSNGSSRQMILALGLIGFFMLAIIGFAQ